MGRRRYRLGWVVLCLLAPVCLPRGAAAGPISTEATAAAVAGDKNKTTFTLTMTDGPVAQVFTLANPYRVILDLPDLTFRLDPTAGQSGGGLISAFRYGLFAEHKARIVIDTTGPVKIASANMKRTGIGNGVDLTIALVPMDAAAFGSGTGPGRTAAQESGQEALRQPPKPKDPARPVIVIDPGHGGIDPGARGADNVPEKVIVLAVAQKLAAALKQTGKYDVKLTRTDDVFVSLDRRLRFSAENGADLFISLHADSIDAKGMTEAIHGATIYTLSDKASDEQARVAAEKENASDLIAGIDAGDKNGGDQVRNILFDLMKRETSNFSADFSHSLAKQLGKTIEMSRIPQRSAAFKVLKQTHAPSVLVELGYISNQSDQQQMMTAPWQTKVAAAITVAVGTYFGKRTSERRE